VEKLRKWHYKIERKNNIIPDSYKCFAGKGNLPIFRHNQKITENMATQLNLLGVHTSSLIVNKHSNNVYYT
jgi:hypothetical protein